MTNPYNAPNSSSTPKKDERLRKPRTCGFRLSIIDVIVLSSATLLTVAAYSATAGFILFVPFVVYHFFLFCNVFRVRRTPELIWAGSFVMNCALWATMGQWNLAILFGTQIVFTAILIMYEVRQPTYHGIYARKINPHIQDYLAGRI